MNQQICIHYFILGQPKGDNVIGVCKYCGVEKSFPATIHANYIANLPDKEGKHKVVVSKLDEIKRYGYYQENKDAILKDVTDIGMSETRKKWNIKSGTWAGLKKQWGLPTSSRKQSDSGSARNADEKRPNCNNCPYKSRLDHLEGYREAMLDVIGKW